VHAGGCGVCASAQGGPARYRSVRDVWNVGLGRQLALSSAVDVRGTGPGD
jgi:hypothetical protein